MGRATAAGVPASNKRETILAAAVACFAAQGLAGTGIATSRAPRVSRRARSITTSRRRTS